MMNAIEIRNAQKIGSWYAVAASLAGIFLFQLLVEIVGVIWINYHPLHLISDLVYIYNYGFFMGIGAAFVLSYFIGKRAGRVIATKNTDSRKVGMKSGLVIFTGGILMGVLVLGIESFSSEAQTTWIMVVRGYVMTFIFLFAIGFFPVLLLGYLYGKLVKRQVTNSTLSH